MEIILIIIGVIIVFGLLDEFITRFKSINWDKFLTVLIIGGMAYAILVILALLFGVFSKKSTNSSYEQGIENSRREIAINLLDILDDQSIANKTKLSIDEVKVLRLNN